jgi:hypothetical protein
VKVSKVGIILKNLARRENRGEGKETERRPERRRKLPPQRKFPPWNRVKISKVGIILKKLGKN